MHEDSSITCFDFLQALGFSTLVTVRFSTAVARDSPSGRGLFSWMNGEKSNSLPPLEFPIEGVNLPPSLLDYIVLIKTKITTLPNDVKIAPDMSPNPSTTIG
ncbi:hypothetical protein Nepgr_018141 [Nepenthes gracilis]|uniref:Uncharacterized protein n=1 Tax=Nepenthes gracilis TaxID=150966 RepID=A0AAD3SSU3_NEPGR|nr:hypothetical protein Nepgr_018141 [Nepenthes gracilis]